MKFEFQKSFNFRNVQPGPKFFTYVALSDDDKKSICLFGQKASFISHTRVPNRRILIRFIQSRQKTDSPSHFRSLHTLKTGRSRRRQSVDRPTNAGKRAVNSCKIAKLLSRYWRRHSSLLDCIVITVLSSPTRWKHRAAALFLHSRTESSPPLSASEFKQVPPAKTLLSSTWFQQRDTPTPIQAFPTVQHHTQLTAVAACRLLPHRLVPRCLHHLNGRPIPPAQAQRPPTAQTFLIARTARLQAHDRLRIRTLK